MNLVSRIGAYSLTEFSGAKKSGEKSININRSINFAKLNIKVNERIKFIDEALSKHTFRDGKLCVTVKVMPGQIDPCTGSTYGGSSPVVKYKVLSDIEKNSYNSLLKEKKELIAVPKKILEQVKAVRCAPFSSICGTSDIKTEVCKYKATLCSYELCAGGIDKELSLIHSSYRNVSGRWFKLVSETYTPGQRYPGTNIILSSSKAKEKLIPLSAAEEKRVADRFNRLQKEKERIQQKAVAECGFKNRTEFAEALSKKIREFEKLEKYLKNATSEIILKGEIQWCIKTREELKSMKAVWDTVN
ncbi:MAG: hypothetical protein ABIH00_06960 [Armatimonadota bacterium]